MKNFIPIFLFYTIMVPVYGQYLESDIIPHIPTSPQAAAFMQYGDMAINYSTGVPDISVPLYEINHHGYKLPLVLKYNPLPLKPGHNFDVYGHGWNLSVQSCVSRTIESAPDETRNFNINTEELREIYFDPLDYNKPRDDLDYYNFSHDKFSVILPNGTSFNFVIDNVGGQMAYTVSGGRQVKISCNANALNLNSFIITDEEGVVYTFNGGDLSRHALFSGHFVSWNLARIDLPYTAEPITFDYRQIIHSSSPYVFFEKGVKLVYGLHYGGYEIADAKDLSIGIGIGYTMQLLTSINFGNTHIDLNYKYNDRVRSHNYIDNIKVYENYSYANKILIREINLLSSAHKIYTDGTMSFDLAKLDNLTINGSNPTDKPKVYKFNYSNEATGYYFSGTDHWGNLNTFALQKAVANINFFVGLVSSTPHTMLNYSGRLSIADPSPTDLCPYYKIKASTMPDIYDPRRASTTEDYGILSRISYPTGGYTNFVFENHKYLTHTKSNGDYIYDRDNREVATAAGFRIRKITNYDADGSVANTKTFEYGKTNLEQYGHVYGISGVGEPVVDPTILTYQNNVAVDVSPIKGSWQGDIGLKNMLLGLSPNGKHEYFKYSIFVSSGSYKEAPVWELTISPTNFRRLLNGRQAVVYPQVTEYYGDIFTEPDNTKGKTVYKYDIYKQWQDLFGNERNDFIFEEPYYMLDEVLIYDAQPFRYNNLIERIDYKFDGQEYAPVMKERYNRSLYYEGNCVDYMYHKAHLFIHGLHKQSSHISTGEFFTGTASYLGFLSIQWKETTIYSGIDSITTTEWYDYNTRHQLVNIKKTTSDSWGDIETTLTYPTSDHSDATIRLLDSKNIISPVIEQTTRKGDFTIAGQKVEYSTTWNNCSYPLPSATYELEIDKSISEYALQSQILDYSPNGNPLEAVSKDGIRRSLIWGYNDRYLIASARNAAAEEIAYTSFEDEMEGWTITTAQYGTSSDKNTGNKFIYNFNITSKQLPPGDYTVCFRAKDNSLVYIQGIGTCTPTAQWKTYSMSVTLSSRGSINLSSNASVDELRIYPTNTPMTTYTYDPLVGVTSITDERNRTTTYKYDGLSRLTEVKDNEGNILEHNNYNYAP